MRRRFSPEFKRGSAQLVLDLAHAGREMRVRVDGQLTFNRLRPRIDAVRHGFGLAYVPKVPRSTNIQHSVKKR